MADEARSQGIEDGTEFAADDDSVQSNSNMLTFGSVMIEINDDKGEVVEGDEVLYRKEERNKLTEDKLADLYDKATKTKHKKFDFINLTLSDEDKLDDTYNLDMIIRKMRSSHYAYDMHNVFTIIILDPADSEGKTIIGTKDLYSEFAEISIEEVMQSNEFYSRWAKATYFKQNLKLTYTYFQNNVSEELWEKTFETYDDYAPQYKGGPLFFIIMIGKLLSNTEEATTTLQNRVKNFKITALPGEDVTRAVSLLKGAIRRLAHIKRKKASVDIDWYAEITRQVIKVMQTTSVDEFNDVFRTLDRDRFIDNIMVDRTLSKRRVLTYESVFRLAETKYIEMNEGGTWTGASTKGNDSVFKAELNKNSPKIECDNCGGPHVLGECKQPRDNARIKENRKKRLSKKKGHDKKKSGKWSNPKPEEKNRRVIDGKQYYFHHKTGRWKLCDDKANQQKPTTDAHAKVVQPSDSTAASVPASIYNANSDEVSRLSQVLAEEQRNNANLRQQMKANLQSLFAQLN